MAESNPSNSEIASILEEVADLLEQQEANPYRVGSYRKAARSIRSADRNLAQLLEEEGVGAIEEMSGIGERLAGSIREIVRTGSLSLLDDLRSEVSPGMVFTRVPGIGEAIARRIHERLGIESLEELEMAAHDGRLGEIEGIGEEMLEGIRNALAGMLSRSAQRRSRQKSGKESRPDLPPIELLLKLDAEYREKAKKDQLKKIAPKRFNPEGEKWLPIMNAERDGWSFTLLFSNTKRAHDLGTTRDWVVIYFKQDGDEDQCTVVTATRGNLAGKRVIRGREKECREFYE